MTLDAIAIKYGTDKSTKVHAYTLSYEHFLADRSVKRILEIGVLRGASLRMWREYFAEAGVRVYGIDSEEVHIKNELDCYLVNQGDKEGLEALLNTIGRNFDLIIDDGSHDLADQIISLKTLWPALNKDGIYVIEDVLYPERFIQVDFIEENCSSKIPIKYRIISSKEPGEFMITYQRHE